jgi:bacillithiol synthase
MSGCLDSFPSPLTEYGTVSAEPAASAPSVSESGGLNAAAIDVRRFPWIRPLAGEYAFNFSRIEDLYAGNPADPQAWRSAIARAQRHPRDRRTLVDLLQRQQRERGAPPAAREAAARLADPSSVAVVTGQQAGVFGGPLFTLLKALTALQLARRARERDSVPAVAIFWVDAEDHDWEEVRSCTVLDAEYQARTLTLADVEGAGERPIAALRLDERVEQTIQELSSILPASEFKDEVIDGVRQAWRPGAGMARAFATWLESLLGRHGLIVYESSDLAAKPLVAGVFTRELSDPGRTATLAADAGEVLSGRGHAPQVAPQRGSLSLFNLDEGRHQIRRQDDHYLVGDRSMTLDALAAQASARPDSFSPNVLLRPIVQDTLFPTICYVAGPSELAYLGQLRGVYDYFGVPMPLMVPRTTATLLDSAATRFLRKYDLALEDLQPQDESVLNRLLEAQLPASVERALRDAADRIEQAMAEVAAAVPSVDPTLEGAAKTTRAKMDHELHALHNKVIQASKRRHDTLRRQFVRAQAQAFPHGHPQERTLGMVYFVAKYGPGLVDRLCESLPLDMGHHWVVTI